MCTAGYYRVSYRALSLRELARMRGLLRLPLAYFVTRFKHPTPEAWMPNSWADLECAPQDLSEHFLQTAASSRREFERLGFTEVGLKKLRRLLNPHHLDNGGINYIDASRRYFGQLIYNKTHVPLPINADREQVTIAFTAVFQHRTLSYTNAKFGFDSPSLHEIVRRPSSDVASLHQAFIERLAQCSQPPRHFPDLPSFQVWFDSNAREMFESRVRRGLFIRMSDDEVEIARRILPPPLQNP